MPALRCLLISWLLAPPAQPIPVPPAPPSTPAEVGLYERLGQPIALDLQLTDSDGKTFPLRSLIDKPTLLTLNYFRCAGICTPQLNGLADAIGRMQLRPGRDYQILTASFDDRDTVEMAARKRTNLLGEIKGPFPPEAWRFYIGPAATTRALAASVGFYFKRQDDDFIHPSTLIILSPAGKVTRYLYGTSYVPAELEMAIQEAGRGQSRPSVSKWLNICFTYDPKGRRYVFRATRVVAAGTLLAALIWVLVLKSRRPTSPKVGP